MKWFYAKTNDKNQGALNYNTILSKINVRVKHDPVNVNAILIECTFCIIYVIYVLASTNVGLYALHMYTQYSVVYLWKAWAAKLKVKKKEIITKTCLSNRNWIICLIHNFDRIACCKSGDLWVCAAACRVYCVHCFHCTEMVQCSTSFSATKYC